MSHLQKIARLENSEIGFVHSRSYRLENTASDSARIVAGIPHGDSNIFLEMASILNGPFYVLYILHTLRGEGQAGRFQSRELSTRELKSFVKNDSDFFSADARFYLWVYSQDSNATIVWERHDLLYAYGPIIEFEAKLSDLSFGLGSPQIDFEHIHFYRAEFDNHAKNILEELDWSYTPLKPEDEQ